MGGALSSLTWLSKPGGPTVSSLSFQPAFRESPPCAGDWAGNWELTGGTWTQS